MGNPIGQGKNKIVLIRKSFSRMRTLRYQSVSMARNPFKKGFLAELRVRIQVFPSGNSHFRMETRLKFKVLITKNIVYLLLH